MRFRRTLPRIAWPGKIDSRRAPTANLYCQARSSDGQVPLIATCNRFLRRSILSEGDVRIPAEQARRGREEGQGRAIWPPDQGWMRSGVTDRYITMDNAVSAPVGRAAIPWLA